ALLRLRAHAPPPLPHPHSFPTRRSSDLRLARAIHGPSPGAIEALGPATQRGRRGAQLFACPTLRSRLVRACQAPKASLNMVWPGPEEHPSELQPLTNLASPLPPLHKKPH